jgi:hypothetical protein
MRASPRAAAYLALLHAEELFARGLRFKTNCSKLAVC